MSHFAVMVVGENAAAQLQPYHEFECTGTDDQYAQDIDITDKRREEYNSLPDSTPITVIDCHI